MAGGIVLAVLALGGCHQAEPRRAPSRATIVSLNPCTDAILAEVADRDQLLALSHYSHDPRATSMPIRQARRWPAHGGTAEEVLAFGPDVVVASTFMPPATASAFARLGLRVEAFSAPLTVAESIAQVRRLSRIAGHPERGEALVRRIEVALRNARHHDTPIPALLWQEGGIVPGPETLIAELFRHTGFASHSAARGLGQGAYLPLEQVLADPPQVLLAAGGDRMLVHPAVRALDGVRYAHVEPSLLYCGGPTIIRAAQHLAQVRRTIG